MLRGSVVVALLGIFGHVGRVKGEPAQMFGEVIAVPVPHCTWS